jgi:hypothetical protein
LSYLFYQGAVTLSAPSDTPEQKNPVKVPNSVIAEEYRLALIEQFSGASKLAADFTAKVSAQTLQPLLTYLLEPFSAEFLRNDVKEDHLRDDLYVGLNSVLPQQRESWVRMIVVQRNPKRCDLMLEMPSEWCILELKRIRPNAVSEGLRHRGAGKAISDQEKIDLMTVENVKTLPIDPAFLQYYDRDFASKRVRTSPFLVGDVFAQSHRQLREYVEIAKEAPNRTADISVRGFLVVQVGTRLIVEGLDEAQPSPSLSTYT